MNNDRKELQIQKRECVFQQLFLSGFYPDADKSEHFELFLDDTDLLNELELGRIETMPPEERRQLQERCEAILHILPELDARINAAAEGWKTTRMSRVDLSLIRLALYEMAYDDSIPLKVAINEAVELAKKYGGSDSPSFVNAILGKLAQTLSAEKDGEKEEAAKASSEPQGTDEEP